MPAPPCAPGRRRLESTDAAVAALPEPADAGNPQSCRRTCARIDRLLAEDHETPGLLRALDGRFIAPVAGGDLMRTPAILPTGRNLHGFDPYRIPSAFAIADGARQAERVLARYAADGHPFPEIGRDRLVGNGQPQERRRADRPGARAHRRRAALRRLWPPERRERWFRSTSSAARASSRCITVSGIFRDLLPLQVRLLAEACFLAATADEPEDSNYRAQARAGTSGDAGLRHRDGGAARVQQRRRRLRRERRDARSTRACGATRTKSRRPSRAANASPMAATATALRGSTCSRAFSRTSISPIRTSTASNSA